MPQREISKLRHLFFSDQPFCTACGNHQTAGRCHLAINQSAIGFYIHMWLEPKKVEANEPPFHTSHLTQSQAISAVINEIEDLRGKGRLCGLMTSLIFVLRKNRMVSDGCTDSTTMATHASGIDCGAILYRYLVTHKATSISLASPLKHFSLSHTHIQNAYALIFSQSVPRNYPVSKSPIG